MTDIGPSSVPIQQESVQSYQPVSESSATSMGGAINYLLNAMFPVGSLMDSLLLEPQLQAQLGNPNPATWVLADGRDVTGSVYQRLTGNTTIPDFRGISRRGLNNGGSAAGTRADGNQNPDDPGGTFTPGQFTPARDGQHAHAVFGMDVPTAGSGALEVRSNNGAIDVGACAAPFNLAGAFPAQQGKPDSGAGLGLDAAPSNNSVATYIRIN